MSLYKQRNRQVSGYLLGIQEDEGLPTENVSASCNCSQVDILLTQHWFINLWDKTEGEKKCKYLDKKFKAGWSPT